MYNQGAELMVAVWGAGGGRWGSSSPHLVGGPIGRLRGPWTHEGNLVPLTEPSELEVRGGAPSGPGGAQSELKTSVPWVSGLRQVPRVV